MVAAQNMHVKMIHLLPTHLSAVDDGAEALVSTCHTGQFTRLREHAAEDGLVRSVGVVQRGYVHLRMIRKCTGACGLMSWKA